MPPMAIYYNGLGVVNGYITTKHFSFFTLKFFLCKFSHRNRTLSDLCVTSMGVRNKEKPTA